MNKMIMGALVLGVIVVLSGWWYTSNQQAMKDKAMMEEKAMAEKLAMEKKEEAMKQPEAMMEKKAETMVKEDAMVKQDDVMMVKGGQYIPYDASKIAFAKDGKVVLFFRASWCPTCRALDANIKANLSQIPQNILILDVDYDKYTDLKKQYGVTYQHTLVQVDVSGNMIAKWSGSEGLNELLAQVK
jgi:thioredoxin 1